MVNLVHNDNRRGVWETPPSLFASICGWAGEDATLDVCASVDNKKCEHYFHEGEDALVRSWLIGDDTVAWCNADNSKMRQFLRKAYSEWKKHDGKLRVIMILPLQSMATKAVEEMWADIVAGNIRWRPIFKRPRFLINGQERYNSPLSYCSLYFGKKKWQR